MNEKQVDMYGCVYMDMPKIICHSKSEKNYRRIK